MLETKILIVGGGPAGATVAKYLSLAKISNILIQKKFDFKKPCGGGVRLDAFKEFNLDEKMIQKYIDTIVLVSQNRRVHIDIKDTPLAIVQRNQFDNYLRDKAHDVGSELYEAKLIDLQIEQDYILSTVRFKDGIKTIKSQYVIAADGVNSLIRKKINGDKVSTLLTNYVDLADESCSDCEFHFGEDIADKYYAWVFPESGGTNIGTLANKDKPYMQNFIKSLNVKEQAKVFGYKIPEFENTIFYKQRVFFVGDSASQVLPFTYEGIYYAMSSAKILSSVLIDNADPNEYEQRWNKKYLKKFTTLRKLQKLFLHNNFTINIMMKLFKSKSMQKKIIDLWLKDKEIVINARFFLKVLKKLL